MNDSIKNILHMLVCLFALCLLPRQATAHSLDANLGLLTINDNQATLVVTPPSTLFEQFDDDQNGLMSVEEVSRHRESLNSLFTDKVQLLNEEGIAGELYFNDIIVPHAFEPNAEVVGDHLLFIRRYRWTTAPNRITFRYSLLSAAGTMMTTVSYRSTLRMQTIIFDSSRHEATLLPESSATFGHFLRLGIKHVLTGYDHLLFLLALLLMGGTWRYLIMLVTIFTVAHSLTLALTAFKIISLPEPLIESMIALSIAYVAIENLWQGKSRWRWLIVFAFGLLHGMGFAALLIARIKELAIPQEQRFIMLLGFNLGVELGQHFFILPLFWLFNHLKNKPLRSAFVRWVSVSVAIVGLYWGIERLFF